MILKNFEIKDDFSKTTVQALYGYDKVTNESFIAFSNGLYRKFRGDIINPLEIKEVYMLEMINHFKKSLHIYSSDFDGNCVHSKNIIIKDKKTNKYIKSGVLF